LAFANVLREGHAQELILAGKALDLVVAAVPRYLPADDREKRGVTQKEVDTMMALCMLLEAQKGHTEVYVGQDTDLLPAAQLASKYQRVFVSPLTNVPMRWRQVQKLAPDISMHPLPVFNSRSRSKC
jgi:uncharacterized LabA/DUF88 family protein